ncbi:MAG: TerB family tellurite resistance protein, partial [Prevotella sp.]|nr:TerB family tellurite resistance protein [Prevotella sp.]
MALAKWIGGLLGWIVSGGSVLGALAGYALGAAFDSIGDSGSSRISGNSTAYGGQAYDEGERNSFLFSMLVLASYIIKADGKVMHSEMEFVRRFLRQNFGPVAVEQGEDILMKLFEQEKMMGSGAYKETIRKAAVEMRYHMNYGMRLQLMHFLVLIALADGTLPQAERDALGEVAQLMGLSADDLEQLLAMGYGYGGDYYGGGSYGNGGRQQGRGSSASQPDSAQKLAQAYKILGISASATDDEVKKA